MRWLLLLLLVFYFPFAASSQDYQLETAVLSGHSANASIVKFSPDGKFLLTSAKDKSIILWELKTGRPIRTFLGTTDSRKDYLDFVRALDFSTDGQMFVAVYFDGTARIWDTATGEEKSHIVFDRVEDQAMSYQKLIDAAVFLPDKKHIALGGLTSDTIVSIWSIESSQVVKYLIDDTGRLSLQDSNYGLKVSPDGKYILTSIESRTREEDGKVKLWDLESGSVISEFKKYQPGGSGDVRVDFDPSGKRFLTGSYEQGISIWDIDKNDPMVLVEPEIISSGYKFMLRDLRFSPGGDIAAVIFRHSTSFEQGDDPIRVHLFDAKTGEETGTIITALEIEDIHGLDISMGGKRLALIQGGIPRIWDLTSGNEINTLVGLSAPEEDFRYYHTFLKSSLLLPNSNLVAEIVGQDVVIWDIFTGRVTNMLKSDAKVLTLASNREGVLLATSNREQLIVWDLERDKKILEKTDYDEAGSFSFNQDGRMVVGHINGRVALWDVSEDSFEKFLISQTLRWAPRFGNTFTPNGIYSVLGVDKNIRIVELESGQTIKELIGHQDVIHSIDFSPNGKQLVSAGWDGRIILWDLYSGLQIHQFKGQSGRVYEAKFVSDPGFVISGGSDRIARLWNSETGEKILEFKGHKGSVTSVDATADMKYLVTGSQDGTVKIWDLKTGQELYTHFLTGGRNWAARTEDGRFYATDDAMKSVFFVRGMESYALDQFFEDYFQPGLIESVYRSDKKTGQRNLLEKLEESPPPVIEIMGPRSGETDAAEVELLVKVTNKGGGIDEIKVMQNGKRIIDDREDLKKVKAEKSIYKTYKVRLVPGGNLLTISAFSNGRIESGSARLNLVRPISEPVANCYILAVGINNYKNPKLNLNYARADAKGFAEALNDQGTKLFKKVEVITLYDREATRQNILARLDEIAQLAQPEDVFYFYYAGHGSLVDDRFYFIPTDNVRLYEQSILEKQAIYAGLMQQSLKNIKALKQVMVIDACHSGGSVELLATRGGAEEKALAQLSRSAGIHVLASAGSEQYAGEFESLGHGVFTYVLLEGLSGKADGAPLDGKITIYELKSYLDDQVPEMTKKFKGNIQYPNTFSRGHDFPMVIIIDQ